MSLTQKKNRYRDGSNGLNIIHHVCMYTLGNKHPVDKSWCNHGQKKWFFGQNSRFPVNSCMSVFDPHIPCRLKRPVLGVPLSLTMKTFTSDVDQSCRMHSLNSRKAFYQIPWIFFFIPSLPQNHFCIKPLFSPLSDCQV